MAEGLLTKAQEGSVRSFLEPWSLLAAAKGRPRPVLAYQNAAEGGARTPLDSRLCQSLVVVASAVCYQANHQL
jgi:hypothetical protein